MKLRLLEYIRCPHCRARLRLADPIVRAVDRPVGEHPPACSGLCQSAGRIGEPGCETCARLEVMAGSLTCVACQARFPISEGVPRLAGGALDDRVSKKAATSRNFGYLWAQGRAKVEGLPSSYHFEKLARTLSLSPPRGLVLDAGCGEGIDLLNQAGRPGVEAIGAELSDGGCLTTAHRILHVPAAHVVQADLGRLPFDEGSFDFTYSYGVLHHMAAPAEGLAELSRVTRSGAPVAIYLYEDFTDRALAWRWLLRAANSFRRVSTRMSPATLYALCRIASPIAYLTFTLPHRVLAHVPGLRGVASGMPFRHGKGPFQLTGDLYDRFSAPIEYRYSRDGAVAFMKSVDLTVVRIEKERGWMALGVTR